MAGQVGIPTVSGMTGAVKSGAIGAIGGAVVSFSQKTFGSGLYGGLAAIALAGSVLKGTAGEIVSTNIGFELGKQIFEGKIGIGATKSKPAEGGTSGFEVI